MKKQLILLTAAVLSAALLGGCEGSSRPIPGEESLFNASSEAAAVSSEPSSGTPASSAASDAASSAPSSAPEETSAPDEAASAPEEDSTPPEESSAEESPAEEGLAGKSIPFTATEVNISDEAMQKADGLLDDKLSYLIHSVEELQRFFDEYADKYSLKDVDAGENFLQASSEMNEEFFKEYNVIIVVQRYKKSDGITVWEVYDGGSSTMIDIYKNAPESEAEAGYTLFLLSGAKDRMGINGVTLNLFPAGAYLSSEPAEEDAGVVLME